MNRLHGKIASIESEGSIALVDVQVGARCYSATLIGAQEAIASWKDGTSVTLLFKEAEVSIAKNLSGLISMRNRLPGKVTAIARGRILTRIALDVDGCTVHALITTRSCDLLQLALGDAVEGLVKANEMNLSLEALT